MSDSQRPKKAKATFFRTRPGGSNRGTGSRKSSGSMVMFTPTQTWRGKTTYQEADATPYYELSDDEETPRRRKIPKTPSGSEALQTTSGLLQDFQEACSMGDGESASAPRRRKVS
jgi:hypothetical protein